MKLLRVMLLPVMILICAPLSAADSGGFIVSAASLKEKASFSSRTLQEVPIGTPVQVGERSGGWQQISLKDNKKGWVRAYQVRVDVESSQTQVVKKKESGGFLSGLANFSRKSSGLLGKREAESNSGDLVATIGVRGLSEEDLKKAKPNEAEFVRMTSYASDGKTAASFARVAGLQAQKVDHLPEPKKK